MATRIRLRRMGAKKRPFYRVVVADQRAPRDGRFIENIGKYHPLEDPSLIEIDEERALHWLRVGAQPSSQVRNLMVKIGIWDRFVEERPAAADLVRKRTEKPEGGKLSKKAAAKAAAEAEAPPAPVEEAAPVGSRPWRHRLRWTRRLPWRTPPPPPRKLPPPRNARREEAPEPRRLRRRGRRRGSSRRGGDDRGVRELVEFLARELVDDPDSVSVTEVAGPARHADHGARRPRRHGQGDRSRGTHGQSHPLRRARGRDPPGCLGPRRHRRLRCPSRPSSSAR